MRVLTISGSLRDGSFNRALLRAAAQGAPPGVELVEAELRGVPVFDGDRETEDARTPALVRLREAVRAADALLVATPEYNQGIPGVLKNAIDWLSRAAPDRVLDGKPAAVIGATPGPWGTRYAQQTTRHVLAATGCVVMGGPMLFVRHAGDVFDGTGELTDPTVRAQLDGVVAALAAWTRTVTSLGTDAGAAAT